MVASRPPADKGKREPGSRASFVRRVSDHLAAVAASSGPVRLQVEPDPREDDPQPEGYGLDPTGDRGGLRAPGLVVKYPGRALLLTGGVCAVHCRFCFRRRPGELGVAGEPALAALEADRSLVEVILSGGDPLGLSDGALERLIQRLAGVAHLRRLRVHTRHPVASPERVTDRLVEVLASSRLQPWVVVHVNHPDELTPQVRAALRRMVRSGLPVLAQSVLLRGVNDDADTLAALLEELVDLGVKPYQLHQLDRVDGAAHFEVSEERGRQLVTDVRRRITGIAMPTWVRDLPGWLSKTVLGALLVLAVAGCDCGEEPPTVEARLSEISASDVQPDPTPPPSLTLPRLEMIERVLAADLDGDGTHEIVLGGANELRWGSWPAGSPAPSWQGRWEGEGALQTWLAADLDGDGADEVVAATGVGRGFAQAKLEVVILDRQGDTTTVRPLWSRAGERNQVTALEPWPLQGGGFGVYLAAFSSRFVVQGGVLALDGGEPAWLDGHELRMGMVRAVADFDGDGRSEVAVGRLYGDDADAHGDLRVLDEAGEVTMIPTLRGVRAVGRGDLDGDGRAELLFGDGWHKNYGKNGRYRPGVARWTDGAWTTELVEERSDQYAVEHIGTGGGLLVAGGNRAVRAYRKDGDAWTTVVGPENTSLQGAWAVLNGELVLGGPRLRRVPLAVP